MGLLLAGLAGAATQGIAANNMRMKADFEAKRQANLARLQNKQWQGRHDLQRKEAANDLTAQREYARGQGLDDSIAIKQAELNLAQEYEPKGEQWIGVDANGNSTNNPSKMVNQINSKTGALKWSVKDRGGKGVNGGGNSYDIGKIRSLPKMIGDNKYDYFPEAGIVIDPSGKLNEPELNFSDVAAQVDQEMSSTWGFGGFDPSKHDGMKAEQYRKEEIQRRLDKSTPALREGLTVFRSKNEAQAWLNGGTSSNDNSIIIPPPPQSNQGKQQGDTPAKQPAGKQKEGLIAQGENPYLADISKEGSTNLLGILPTHGTVKSAREAQNLQDTIKIIEKQVNNLHELRGVIKGNAFILWANKAIDLAKKAGRNDLVQTLESQKRNPPK